MPDFPNPAGAPVTIEEILHQCGHGSASHSAAAPPPRARELALHVVRETLPALRHAHLPHRIAFDDAALFLRPDLRRALVLLCAADYLRRTIALPGVAEAATVAGVQIGKSALPGLADRFEAEAMALLRRDAPFAAPSAIVAVGDFDKPSSLPPPLHPSPPDF